MTRVCRIAIVMLHCRDVQMLLWTKGTNGTSMQQQHTDTQQLDCFWAGQLRTATGGLYK